MQGKLNRLEKAMRGKMDYLELTDGTRYYFDPMDVAMKLFLEGLEKATGAPSKTHTPRRYGRRSSKLHPYRGPASRRSTDPQYVSAAWFTQESVLRFDASRVTAA